MKTPILIVLLIASISILKAERVEVYECDTKSHEIEWGEEGDEDTMTFLTFHRVGVMLGTIDTGEVSFSKLATDAAAYDSSSDPFFGPGINYIVKDSKGNHFIVFFEYEDGNRTFNGFRMAINKTTLIDPKLKVFEGSPYAGTSFDKSILAQLKALIQKKTAEQVSAGRPATRSESDSEGSDKPQPESEGRFR